MRIEHSSVALPTIPKPLAETNPNPVPARITNPYFHFGETSSFEKSAPRLTPGQTTGTAHTAKARKTTKAQTTTKAKAATTKAPAKTKKKGFFAKIGSAISGAAKKVGSVIGKVVERPVAVVKNLARGIGDAAVGVVKNIGEAVSTFGGGVAKVFKGDFKGGFKDMGMSLVKAVQTPVDATLLLGGKLISGIQTLIGVEPVGRKLTQDEIAELKKVYGDSIDYTKVEVKEGNCGLLTMSGRAFVLGSTIYLPPNSKGDKETLVHEAGHIWQHQHGGTDYLSEALWGQFVGDGYDFAKGIQQGKSFSELNPEQQAQLISTAYGSGFFDAPGKRFVYQGTDYTDYLNNALSQVRAGKGAP